MTLDQTKFITIAPDTEAVTSQAPASPVAGEALTRLEKMKAQVEESQKLVTDIDRIAKFYDSGKYQLPDITLVASVVADWEHWNATNPH